MRDISDMAVFVRVAELCSLSAAGRDLRMSPAVVSNRIGKLEDRLGVRLLNRTTRKVHMTEEGEFYYEHCLRILEEMRVIEDTLTEQRQAPRGVLKVTMPTSFGQRHVAPYIPEFADRFPEIEVRLQLTERLINLVEEGMDLGIRVGRLDNPAQIARTLAPDHRLVCAAPAYLEKQGTPRTPEDLLSHNCLLLRFPGSQQFKWPLEDKSGETVMLPVNGDMDSNNSEVLLQWALAGRGLVLKSTWEIYEHLKRGELVPVLTDYRPRNRHVSALFPHSRYLAPKVRAFVDFVIEKFGKEPYWDEGLGF